MPPIYRFWGLFAGLAALFALFMFLARTEGTREKLWQFVKPDLIEKNASLKNEIGRLKLEIEGLNKQNRSLKKYLDAYENNFIELKNAARNCYQFEALLPADLPVGLTKEPFEIRQIFRDMLNEKKRWDQYQQVQYKHILESTVEPNVIEARSLELEHGDNREYFDELEAALNLHKRLIRDVRLFHDEIQFQKTRQHAQEAYELYDLKFKLGPFARESALVDALQQVMSALSAGIYQQEAVEVLDRIGEEFTKPIQQLYEQPPDANEPPVPSKYDYNLYTRHGKKLMDYCDKLARQSSIPLGPSAFGELDFFNRRVSDSFYDLYQVGHNEAIDPSNLDLDELEQVLQSLN